uniref:Uncharacterized protein n=1 Tax=Phlebotomus papatasi TaxID=29031 RepID=A0A1B0D7X6_PHLPP
FPILPPPPGSNSAAPGGGGGQANAGNKRLQQTQAQVDEVVGIMRVNVEKVLERDQKLSELDQRADALQHGASQFEQQAGKLKRKHWWANIKMMIIMGRENVDGSFVSSHLVIKYPSSDYVYNIVIVIQLRDTEKRVYRVCEQQG